MQFPLKQKITAKQSRFVDFYLQDLNATGAARRAGFSNGEYGRQLIMKPAIQAAIKERQKVVESQTNITIARVIQELTELYAEAKEKGEYSTATRILELLGKHVGAFQADNKQRDRSVTVVMNFSAPDPIKEAVVIEQEED